MDSPGRFFESVGWGFESLRGRCAFKKVGGSPEGDYVESLRGRCAFKKVGGSPEGDYVESLRGALRI